MNKKEYMKPAMRVVQLQHKSHILAGSNFGAKSVSNSDGIGWQTDGFSSGEGDY